MRGKTIMTKAEQIFCKNNPKTEALCKGCNKKTIVKTADYIKSNIYKHKCKFCNKTTDIDVSRLKKEIGKNLNQFTL